MTISKGSPWGRQGGLPPDAAVACSDVELAELWADHLGGGSTGPLLVGLAGGDLHRTMGAPAPERMHGVDAWHFPVDMMLITVDDGRLWGAAHVLVGSVPPFRGWSAVVMNAAFVGEWNLGPRAHPNDGLLDVTVGSLGLVDRRRARARMGLGAHIPHPALEVRRVGVWETTRPGPVGVRVDGRPVGRASRIRVEVVPDALIVVL